MAEDTDTRPSGAPPGRPGRGVRNLQRLGQAHSRHGLHWTLHRPHAGAADQTRRTMLLLDLPTAGLALSISVLTTFGPVVLLRLLHSPSRVGLLIGVEGAFALVVPVVAGNLSDRLPAGGWGRRLPFVAAGLPLAVTGLLVLPFGRSAPVAGGGVLLFYVGYYLYYPPYRAMFADLLPRELYARAQSGQAIARGIGLGIALLAGGLLLGVATALPFVLAAVLLVVTTGGLLPVLHPRGLPAAGPRDQGGGPDGPATLPYRSASVGQLLRHDRSMQLFAAANACWEFSFAGLKTFVVLYVTRGLGRSTTVATGVIAVVAVAYVLGAPLAGALAERRGMVPVMALAAGLFGGGLVLGAVPTSLDPMLVLLPFVALAGAVLLTLPQALAFTLTPAGSEGAAAGLLDLSRGVGVVLGPVCVGIAVGASRHLLSGTHGYGAMWPTIGIPVLATLPLLAMLRSRESVHNAPSPAVVTPPS